MLVVGINYCIEKFKHLPIKLFLPLHTSHKDSNFVPIAVLIDTSLRGSTS